MYFEGGFLKDRKIREQEVTGNNKKNITVPCPKYCHYFSAFLQWIVRNSIRVHKN